MKIKTLIGSDVEIPNDTIEAFTASLRGEAIDQSHENYDVARQVWNAMIDKKPAIIVQATGAADVITVVRFANEHQLLLSIKGGGHNIAGSAVCEGGVMIDLGLMNGVQVNPKLKTVSVQGGCLLGDVDHETQAFGLAVPTGINSTTGIAGLALGGGYGWMSRKFGHTVDNMLSVDIVTPDGELVHASNDENQELFWAVRGGSGNFGVVTNFEFQLHAVGPTILSGPCIYPLDEGGEIFRKFRDLEQNMPDEASIWTVIRKAPPFPFLDEKDHGRPVIIFAMSYMGDMEEGERVLAPYRNLGTVLGDGVGPVPYTEWQAAFDPLVAPRARNYWKSSDFTELSDEFINILLGAVDNMPSDECEIFVAQLGGAAGRVAVDAMAYPHRSTRFTMNIHGRWQTEDMDGACVDWVRGLFEEAEKYSTGSVYVNFVPEYDEVRRVGPYGSNQGRLEEIKSKIDPNNLFRTNINISVKKNANKSPVL